MIITNSWCHLQLMLMYFIHSVYGWFRQELSGNEGDSFTVQVGYIKGANEAQVDLTFRLQREFQTASGITKMLNCILVIFELRVGIHFANIHIVGKV